jgi:hypothetical protein
MARKKYTPEEIIQHLRTAEIEQSKGLSQADAARKIGITPITLYRDGSQSLAAFELTRQNGLKSLSKKLHGFEKLFLIKPWIF